MGTKTRVTFAAATAIAVAFLPKVEDTKYEVYTDIAGVPTVCEGITGPDVIKGASSYIAGRTTATRKRAKWRSQRACIIAGFRNINYALRI